MEEKAIDVMHYIRIIWKRKILIFAIVIISMATTFFIIQAKPDIYQASGVMQLGVLDKKGISKEKMISLINVQGKQQVLAAIKKTVPVQEYDYIKDVKINIDDMASADLLNIEVAAKRPQDAKLVCEELIKKYVNYGNNFIKKKADVLLGTVANYNKQIEELEGFVSYTKDYIANLVNSSQASCDEYKMITKQQIDSINVQIESLTKEVDYIDDLLSQEQISLSAMSIRDIMDFKNVKRNYQGQISSLQTAGYKLTKSLMPNEFFSSSQYKSEFLRKDMYEIDKMNKVQADYLNKIFRIREQKYKLEKLAQYAQYFEVISLPSQPSVPASKDAIKMTIIAGLLSLLIGVLLSFLIEYWRKFVQ